jgi:hypothetical protein
MRFRLAYNGPLRPSQRDPVGGQTDRLAAHKHSIRRVFHVQLKELWQTNKLLREHELSVVLPHTSRPIADEATYWGGPDVKAPMADVLADRYKRFGQRFVPLVREEIYLACSLDILFLRRDIPGGVFYAGDIDNRIKTLIDALRMPGSPQESVESESLTPEEDPLYCLLEDDKVITALSVETDTLLAPVLDDRSDPQQVQLVITAKIQPYYATLFNLSFA